MRGINCLVRQSPAQRISTITTTQQLRHSLRTKQQSSSRVPVRPRPLHTTAGRRSSQPADNPNFTSIVDNPAEIVRTGRRHGPGLIILALIPLTAFALGTWQIFRLRWKTTLIAQCEDRLVRPPLPLPPRIDPASIPGFNYRRVRTTGTYRHDQEMLVGPRMRDGEQGYLVITPLEIQGGGEGATVLINRGWIPKAMRRQADRGEGALPRGPVEIEGMLREPWLRNYFTPTNRPDRGEFYFPDVEEMAALTGSQAVWVEQTMDPNFHQVFDMIAKGIPVGKPAEVNLRNNHAQYIFTWYGLGVATSIMFWMLVRKPPSDVTRRVRMNKQW